MRQGSYVILLIAMTVMMAVMLSAAAIAFDKYVIKSESEVKVDLEGVTSDIMDGNVLNSMIEQFQQLV
jgi:hypothetical protein